MVKPNLVDNDNKVSFLKAVCSLVGGSRCNTQQQLQCSARLMAYLMQFMLTLDSFVKELHLSGYVCVIISLMICPAVQQSHPTRFMAELTKHFTDDCHNKVTDFSSSKFFLKTLHSKTENISKRQTLKKVNNSAGYDRTFKSAAEYT